jgi:hypothetical protein
VANEVKVLSGRFMLKDNRIKALISDEPKNCIG